MRVLVTGATGFLGRELVGRLAGAGHSVSALARNPAAALRSLPSLASAHAWHASAAVPTEAFAGVHALVHLAGENVGRWPWTEARKRGIRDSRIQGARALVDSLAAEEPASRPKVLVTASGVGFYGDGGDAWKREGDAPGSGFLANLVKDWEEEVFKAEALGIRTVALRMGVVLGWSGALPKMLPAFRLGLGAVVGDGRQYFSWIHHHDAVGAFIHALENEAFRGPVNVAAPEPPTNRGFSQALARALGRPLFLRAPAFAISLGLGEMGRETLLTGQRASAEKLASLGYHYRYPRLEEALRDILAERSGKRGRR
jgi:uncharacterized protein (TIGR01777 family)